MSMQGGQPRIFKKIFLNFFLQIIGHLTKICTNFENNLFTKKMKIKM